MNLEYLLLFFLEFQDVIPYLLIIFISYYISEYLSVKFSEMKELDNYWRNNDYNLILNSKININLLDIITYAALLHYVATSNINFSLCVLAICLFYYKIIMIYKYKNIYKYNIKELIMLFLILIITKTTTAFKLLVLILIYKMEFYTISINHASFD